MIVLAVELSASPPNVAPTVQAPALVTVASANEATKYAVPQLHAPSAWLTPQSSVHANASEAAPAVECDFRASAPRYVTRAELRRWQWLAGGALVALAAAQVAMFLRK